MNLAGPFIKRPVMTTVLTVAVILAGLLAYRTLPVALLPNVSFPTIMVSASLPGASAQTMASAVASPLENQFSSIPGLIAMSSESRNGNTRITLQFDLKSNIDAASQEVQAAVGQAAHFLPPDMPQTPLVRQVNPAQSPIMFIGLSAPNMPLYKLDAYAEQRYATELSSIPGVAQVRVFGGQTYAVRIYLNPYALAARKLSLLNVESAIGALNVNLPQGTLQGNSSNYDIHVDGQLSDAAAYNHMILAYSNGAPVRLSAVGRAENSVQQNLQSTWINGDRGIILAVVREPNSNTVSVADQIHSMLPRLQAELPGGARLHVLYDKSLYVKAAVEEVQMTLILASVLVALVIWLFLGNFRQMLVAAIAIPISILGTFAVLSSLGYSLNILTLLALTLSVGFVVDDAVVMLENIFRHRESGVKPLFAALQGSREIGFTVLSMTLSLAAVFLPLIFMGGLIGRMFLEFGITIAVVILVSGAVSLSLTPMLLSRMPEGRRRANPASFFQRAFMRLTQLYGDSLAWSLRHRGWGLGLAGLSLIATLVLFMNVQKAFIPSGDSGLIIANLRYPEGIPFQKLTQEQQSLARRVQENPAVRVVMSSAGQSGGGFGGSNVGRLVIHLKPASQRANVATVLTQLRQIIKHDPLVRVFFLQPPAIRLGAISSNAHYQFVLQADSETSLEKAVQTFQPALRRIPGVIGVNSSLQLSNPEIRIHILRARAAALGVTPQNIEKVLDLAYGGSSVGTIYGAAQQYQVMAQLAPEFQKNAAALSAIDLPGKNGELVPLSAITRIDYGVGPLSVEHYGQLPSATISFNLKPGISLGEVTGRIRSLATQILPGGVSGQFAGSAHFFQESLTTLPVLLLITILVIYVILAILYEHFIHPLTILTALPLAGFGALFSLYVFHQPLDLFSFVGIIMLVGLVKKNGIIMIDFAIERRRQGENPLEAIHEACVIRFRPIMMTTAAAILGTLPIALGIGSDASAHMPLGVAVVGGLLFSQILTLYVTPSFYVVAESWLARRRQDIQR